MIPAASMVTTVAAALRSALLRAARCAFWAAWLGGCAALPAYNTPLPPVPEALQRSDDQFTMPDGAVLPVRTWRPDGPPRAVVLALHGLNDSRDAWALPGPVFAAAGVAVYAPDQRGFGAAPGRGTWPGGDRLRADASAMLRLLRARHPGVPLFAMGESMGGAVLMTLAVQPDAPAVDGWVLVAPAVWARSQMGLALSTGLWLVSSVAPGLQVTGAEVPIRVVASDNREAVRALGRNPLTIRRTRFDVLRGLTDLMDEAQRAAPRLPGATLVLYGERDALVPEDAMRLAWAALPAEVRRAAYPAGYHLLLQDLGRAAPTGDALAWMRDPGGWLPSGADVAAAAWRARGR